MTSIINQHIDPSLDLEEEILRLKQERNAVILAHYQSVARKPRHLCRG
jgi:quinolinate synthase